MLDSIYHMTLKLLKIMLMSEKVKIYPILRSVIMDVVIMGLVVYQCYRMALYPSQTQGYVIKQQEYNSKVSLLLYLFIFLVLAYLQLISICVFEHFMQR